MLPSFRFPVTLKKRTRSDPQAQTSTHSVQAGTPDTKGKAATVGSALSKELSVKPDWSWGIPESTMSQMEHLDTILPRFLSGYICPSAEKQPGKEVHKLLLNKSSKFSKII